jgi:hypothetical protein
MSVIMQEFQRSDLAGGDAVNGGNAAEHGIILGRL